MKAKCIDCEREFDNSLTACPYCGSNRREIQVNDSISFDDYEYKINSPNRRKSKSGKKKIIKETYARYDSTVDGEKVKKEYDYDYKNDRYYEHVETMDGKVLKHCDEKLTEHIGHGSAKFKDTLYIVMPAYNEQEMIENVVRSWYKVLDFVAPESKLVVADSGSTDKTHEILSKLKLELPKLYILEDTIKYHGGKLIALYKYAIKQRAEYIFQTDSDGQTNPDEFIEFWNERNKYDAILGNRAIRGDGASRKLVENTVCLLLKLIFGISVPDANAPFRLLKTSLVNKYIDRFKDDYNIPNIMLTTFFKYYNEKINFKVITFKPRQGGVNSINLVKISKIGINALKDFAEFKKGM